jgi:formylglycine-generating enzyme required for sulfatase activity
MLMPVQDTVAQEPAPDSTGESSQARGKQNVDPDYELDLDMPAPEPGPSTPDTSRPGESATTFDRELAIEHHLAAALKAEQEGRIDQPPGDCAWFHYRSVLDIDPANLAADEGLRRVQDHMIESALQQAREMDYESAERILEDAALVREDPSAIEQASDTIRDIRQQRASELEISAVQAMDSGDFDRAERALVGLIALGDMDTTVAQLRRRMEEARIYGGFKPGQTIRDHFMNRATWTPDSVIVTAGSFVMGSSVFQEGRDENEGPEHRVTFRRGFAIGRTEVTVEQFRTFVEHTGYKTDAEKLGDSMMYDHRSGRLAEGENISWKVDYEGRKSRDDEPVVHVSWNDARAYARWLADGTGKPYRLPSEAEFEYTLRGGHATPYWWGDGAPDRAVENLTGERDVSRSQRQWSTYFEGYSDRYWGPAPVASFEPNPYGVYDIAGNVSEWVMDCWHSTYLRAPTDGSAWLNPGCKLRVVRGGSWASSPDQTRATYRVSAKPSHRDARVGFRIARDL